MKSFLAIFSLCLCVSVASGMDYFSALGQIESGDCDSCIGSAGEVSRYQISVAEWNKFSKDRIIVNSTTSRPIDSENEADARDIAFYLVETREWTFEKATGRKANERESYALWNAPGTFRRCGYVYARLSPKVRERCDRFANLVNRDSLNGCIGVKTSTAK